MAEGLRHHFHQEFEYHTVQYFDKKRHIIVKKIQKGNSNVRSCTK